MACANDTWPVRFRARFPIRIRGEFTLHAVTDDATGRDATLVLPHEDVDPAQARRALARLRDTHALLSHPLIPQVMEAGVADDEPPFAVLDFDATADLNDVLRRASEQGVKLSYGAGDAFIAQLREALQHAHTVEDPRRGGPLCLGRIAYSNVLFRDDGEFRLIGFGHNIIADDCDERFSGEAACFQAPEVAMHRDNVSPSGDYLALLLLMRSLLPMVEFPPVLQEVVLGRLPGPESEILRTSLEWMNLRVYGAAPAERASVAEAVQVSNRLREEMGFTLDRAGFQAAAHNVLTTAPRTNVPTPRNVLTLGPDARWMSIDGGPRETVSKRGPMRAILLALAAHHTNEAGLSRDALFESGWPGERVPEASKRNRIYVAIATLRRAGLRDAIVHDGDGYRFAPTWDVEAL